MEKQNDVVLTTTQNMFAIDCKNKVIWCKQATCQTKH